MKQRGTPGDGSPDEHPYEDSQGRPMGVIPDAGETMDQAREEERQSRARMPAALRMVDSVVRVVMVVMIVVLVVAVGANVFGRFVLGNSLPASQELARFLFIWVIFLGAALAHLHNEHIAVSMFVDRLPRAVRRWAVVVSELIILLICVALLLSAVRVMSISPGTSALLNIPLTWVNFSVPLAAAMMAAVTSYRIVVAVRALQQREVAP